MSQIYIVSAHGGSRDGLEEGCAQVERYEPSQDVAAPYDWQSRLPQEAALASALESRRPDPWPGDVSAGFPRPTWVPSVGKLRIAVLFIDFPDGVADYSTRVEAEHIDTSLFWHQNLATIEKYLETVSYGKLDVEMVPLHGWLRARHSLAAFLTISTTGNTWQAPYRKTLASGSLPYGDGLPEIDVVVTVLPSAYFWSGQSAGAVQISDKLIPTLQIGFRPRPVSYDTAGEWGSLGAHELAHVLGLPDLYPKNQSGYKGGFDIPSPPADMNWVWVEAGLMGLQGHYLAPESATRGFGRALAQEGDGSQTPTPESDGLFYEVDGDPPPSIGVDALNSRLVGIDFGQLSEVTKSLVSTRDPVTRTSPIPQTLVLNLFDDVEFIGIVEHVEPTSSGHALWGGLEGVELGTMTLVVNGSVVVGTVRTPGAVYSIRTAGDGTYVIRRIDESSLPPLGEPLEGPLSTPETRSESDDVPPDDGYMIDVMVVYTPLAKHREGGRAAIEALIDLFVAETNQAYAISGVIHRINLMLREEVDYTEDGDSIIDLRRLSNGSDGHMDHVHELRDLYAADLVHIVVGRSDTGGRAYINRGESPAEDEAYGFGLTVDYRGGLVFAHELGHNMGLASRQVSTEENPRTGSHYRLREPTRMFDAWRS